MRSKNKILSMAMVFIFALAFLVPTLGMPATAAAAEPSVKTLSYDIDDDYVTLYANLYDSDNDYSVDEYGFYADDSKAQVSSRDSWSSKADGIDDGEFYLQIPVSDFEDGIYYYRAYVKFDDGEENVGLIKLFVFDEDGSNSDVEVNTVGAEDIGDDYATLVGEIDTIDTDDYTITGYGFYWDTDRNEVEDGEDGDAYWEEAGDDELEEGDEFKLDIDDLDEDETYYFMAYVDYEDSDGDDNTAYGDVESFSTGESNDDPEVTTNSASSIDSDSAILNGTIESYGDDNEMTEYGFYYGTSSSPTTKKKVGDYSDNIDEGDSFNYELTGLKADTQYYFQAYGRNSAGLAYGAVKSFTTKEGVAVVSPAVFTIGSNFYLQNNTYKMMDAAPYIKNSRTYLPIRYVGYAMGLSDAQIQWNEAAQQVTLTNGSKTVILNIGSKTIYSNGTAITMDVAPEITNSRTCLPIAWVAAAFGHTAVWDGISKTVTIY